MLKKIMISSGSVSLEAVLYDSHTVSAIHDQLPITGTANIWGEEIYFDIPVKMEQDETAREVVEVGELGYWSMGEAFCIFFGPTPISTDDQPRAYSPVNIIGKICGNATRLKSVQQGDLISIDRLDDGD